jgi:hypothetical protein
VSKNCGAAANSKKQCLSRKKNTAAEITRLETNTYHGREFPKNSAELLNVNAPISGQIDRVSLQNLELNWYLTLPVCYPPEIF